MLVKQLTRGFYSSYTYAGTLDTSSILISIPLPPPPPQNNVDVWVGNPVLSGSIEIYINLYSSSPVQIAVDDGLGSFTSINSTYTVTGHVDYHTGLIGVDISPAPDGGDTVYAMYEKYSGKIFDGRKLYFDDGVSFDHINHPNFDAASTSVIRDIFEIIAVDQYFAKEHGIQLSYGVFTGHENSSNFVNLMKLVPEKFHDSIILQQFLYEAGLQVGSWLGDINDLEAEIDKYRVGDDYINYLSDLIGLTMIVDDTTTIADKRKQLIEAIDWYKMRGTYQSIQHISYLLDYTLNLYDLYTTDYVTFVREPWFVGYGNENPGGLSSAYYKSPHFGIDLFLDTQYGTSGDYYLFQEDMYTNLTTYTEQIRPVNTVFDYSLMLNPICDETGIITTVDGNIHTSIQGSWSSDGIYFDDTSVSGGPQKFDNSKHFDYTKDALYNSITTWKLGTGSKGLLPTPGFVLENVVLTGSINTITIGATYVEYSFYAPSNTIQAGISELGLYLIDGTTLKVASTFPDIDVIDDVTLRVSVRVYY